MKPEFPTGAFHLGIDGSLVLEATIGGEGTIQDLKVVASEPTVTELAADTVVDAVKQWRYQPTFRQGKPVEVATTITIKFVL